MKKVAFILGLGIFSFYGCGESTESLETTDSDTTTVAEVIEEEPTGKVLLSPRMQANGNVNGVEVAIDYGAPSVRERAIWGDLVKYDKIWRAGANETTALTFSADTKLNGNPVKAGTYALFIIPKAEGDWTVVLNEEWSVDEHDAWGSSHYKEEKDVLRFNVTPEWAENSEELLSYSITETALNFSWEKARLSVKIG